MTVRPPVSRLAALLVVLALFAAQIAGLAQSYICDCSGVSVAVQSDHCHGPHGAGCHEETEDAEHHHDDGESEGERREHSVESEDLVGVAGAVQPVPVAPLLAVLPTHFAAYCPPPVTLEWHEVLCRDALPPPDIVRTVVLLI